MVTKYHFYPPSWFQKFSFFKKGSHDSTKTQDFKAHGSHLWNHSLGNWRIVGHTGMKLSSEISSIMKVSQPFYCNRKQKIKQGSCQAFRWKSKEKENYKPLISSSNFYISLLFLSILNNVFVPNRRIPLVSYIWKENGVLL